MISNGNIPPTKNSVCQSISLPPDRARSATKAPPAGRPQNMLVVVPALLSGGLISVAIAIKFGMAPPKPRPVRNRARTRVSKLQDAAVAREKTPNAATESARMGFRPHRSAMLPPRTAPIIMPTMATLPAQPIWLGPRCS